MSDSTETMSVPEQALRQFRDLVVESYKDLPDPATGQGAPDWIDVDAIADRTVRKELGQTRRHLELLLPLVVDFFDHYQCAITEWQTAVADAGIPDELLLSASRWVGREDIEDLLHVMMGLAETVGIEAPTTQHLLGSLKPLDTIGLPERTLDTITEILA